MKARHSKAFTLIELLIVVVIIGILAGIVLSVLNPAQQQRRAREGVLQASTGKLCTGLFACAATTTTIANCDSDVEIGVTIPTGNPAGSSYSVGAISANEVEASGTLDGCSGFCRYNFTTSTPTALDFTGCIVGGL